MSIFGSFKNQEVKIEETKDVIGGGNKFGIVDTDIYTVTIKQAYVDYSKGGAMSINLEFHTDSGNVVKSQQWVTSGNAKGNKNYYTDSKGNNHFLPGYVTVDDICKLAAEAPLSSMDTEEKMVQVYDFEQGKQVAKPFQVLVDLIGTKVDLAIEKQIVDKNVNDGTGNYVPSGETREQNEVVKAFCADDKVTVTEKKAGLTEANFYDKWVAKNKGEVINKAKGVPAQADSTANALSPSKAKDLAEKTTNSLFG